MKKNFCILLILTLGSCQVGRYIVYNFAGIKDHKIFPTRNMPAPEQTFYFTDATQTGKDTFAINSINSDFDNYLEDNKTVAFLIIRNDSLLYEKYFNKYEAESIVPSFSMAKSITSLLIGCAIDDGFIQSVDEPVSKYVPELKEAGFDEVKISHVLNMTAGIDIDESYINPFGHAAAIYYGRKLRKQVFKYDLKEQPGNEFEYTSGTTQLLGLILERALKDEQTITEYFNQKIWQPLEMEYDGSWSIDKKKDGMEKTFCCINARARDYAKIGRLMLNKGNWNGQQIVSKDWVEHSTKIDTTNGSVSYYQNQWWIISENEYMAQGILGQYIYVNHEKNIVIIRLGKKRGEINWWGLFPEISSRL